LFLINKAFIFPILGWKNAKNSKNLVGKMQELAILWLEKCKK